MIEKLKLTNVDVLNIITHFIGIILSIFVLIFLPQFGETRNQCIGLYCYGIGMILMFGASTLYHCFINTKASSLLQKIDHSMIFVFILATYIPISIYLDTKKAYIILAFVFIICVLGIFFKIFYAGKFKILSTILYVILGWSAIFEIKDIFYMLPPISIFYLIGGGVIYSIGAVIYAKVKWKYGHVLWHVFVFVACLFQLLCIYYLYR